MRAIELIVMLLAVSAALRMLARRVSVPHPVLLVLGGFILAFIPRLPQVEFDPEILFLIFVPPLLYWAALNTSLRDFRAHLWEILRYATIVVLLTIAMVAVVVHALLPEFTWPVAFVLGAIVSPPDPVAAVAVLRTLGAPRDSVTVLEGEGLFNDATALVAYRMAVAAAVTGTFSAGEAAVRLVLTGIGGAVVGLAVGWLIGQLRRRMQRFPIVENTLSLLTPFLAYLPAEWLQVSGVISVVVVGLYLGRLGPRVVSAATRVQAESMWTMLQFVLESVIFILIGLELPSVVRALRSHSLERLIGFGALISLVVILVRLAYTFGFRSLLRRARGPGGRPVWSWQQALFVAWAGIRGGDSLVIALALPLTTAWGSPFPARALTIFLTFCVILATLVLQGSTLVPLLRWLDFEEERGHRAEEAHARRVLAQTALKRFDEEVSSGRVDQALVPSLRQHYLERVRRWTALDRSRHTREDEEHRRLPDGDEQATERRAASFRAVRRAMIQAEREAMIDLRDQGVISDDVLRRLQRELDLETMMLESSDDGASQSPYVPDA